MDTITGQRARTAGDVKLTARRLAAFPNCARITSHGVSPFRLASLLRAVGAGRTRRCQSRPRGWNCTLGTNLHRSNCDTFLFVLSPKCLKKQNQTSAQITRYTCRTFLRRSFGFSLSAREERAIYRFTRSPSWWPRSSAEHRRWRISRSLMRIPGRRSTQPSLSSNPAWPFGVT